MLFLALVMMPFYYISKPTRSWISEARLANLAVPCQRFRSLFMTVLMSGVNMFAMAKVMQIVLGWDIISASGFRL